MGGDNAPQAPLEGALIAADPKVRAPRYGTASHVRPERVLLVGDKPLIEHFLAQRGGNPGFSIQHASQVIGMADAPAQALRAKPDASIAVCVGATAKGSAGAVVSMGNTGAVVGAATLGLGTLEGVKRPAIAVTLELTGAPVTLLDMGANASPKPQHLAQNALMGAVLARDCLGVAEPRVGLLNIGTEPGKGTDLLKEAFPLIEQIGLEQLGARFHGNVEASGLFGHAVDVVVTDGFTGNVALKLLESFAGFLMSMVVKECKRDSQQIDPRTLQRIQTHIDYAEYGGALLLGVRGIVVKGHGRSDAGAVANALRAAQRALDSGVNEHIVLGVAARAATEGAAD
jgi:glycerol-3-phosphate acyltransferase PlsX